MSLITSPWLCGYFLPRNSLAQTPVNVLHYFSYLHFCYFYSYLWTEQPHYFAIVLPHPPLLRFHFSFSSSIHQELNSRTSVCVRRWRKTTQNKPFSELSLTHLNTHYSLDLITCQKCGLSHSSWRRQGSYNYTRQLMEICQRDASLSPPHIKSCFCFWPEPDVCVVCTLMFRLLSKGLILFFCYMVQISEIWKEKFETCEDKSTKFTLDFFIGSEFSAWLIF